MIASIAITLALHGAAQTISPSGPLVTVERLAAAATARRGDGAAENVTLPVQKARLSALVQFVVRFHARMSAGEWTGSDMFNLQQVTRDVVEAGSGLAVLPEERLCWQRAGLNLAYVQYHMVSARVAAGAFPPHHQDHARAQVEYFRTAYNRALAECVTAPR